MGDSGNQDLGAVTRRSSDPRPLGGLADLAELVGGDSERSKRFMGGLVAGAVVGAAIAGALLVRRRTARWVMAERAESTEPTETTHVTEPADPHV
jgi:hypothetical protein